MAQDKLTAALRREFAIVCARPKVKQDVTRIVSCLGCFTRDYRGNIHRKEPKK